MRGSTRFGLALLTLAAVLAGGLALSYAGRFADGTRPGAAAAEPSAERVISVSGEGRVFARPDLALITLGVELSDPDLSTVQQQANQRMDAVFAELESRGIPEDKIETVTYSIWVERDYERPDQPITGYRVTYLVEVHVQPVDRAGEIIEAAVSAGANTVPGVSFTVADPAALLRQARERAMADARDKAAHLAQLAGVSLGAPVRIAEGSAYPVPVPVERAAADAASALPPGQTVVTVSVAVDYAIE